MQKINNNGKIKVVEGKTPVSAPKAKLTTEQFVTKAIETFRTGSYKGIHSVWCKEFTNAWAAYYPDLDRVTEVKKLVADGKIAAIAFRGGPMLYKPSEAPTNRSGINPEAGKANLKAMGL